MVATIVIVDSEPDILYLITIDKALKWRQEQLGS